MGPSYFQECITRHGITRAWNEASFKLTEYLCDKYNILRRAADGNGDVTGHFSIDPINRADCPNTFPWDELWSYWMEV